MVGGIIKIQLSKNGIPYFEFKSHVEFTQIFVLEKIVGSSLKKTRNLHFLITGGENSLGES